MNDDQRLLASAVLDGDVTAEERARAEADQEVAAEVERLRRARDAVRAVEPADADRREVAITAALAAFDRPERTVVAPPPPSVVGRHRRRWTGPLAAAAAVAVIAVGAVVATRDGDGGDDDLSSSAATVEQDTTERQLNAVPAPAEAEDASGDVAADTDATAVTDAASAAGGTAQELAPTSDAGPLASPEELAAFATTATRSATASGATCQGGTFIAAATYLVDGLAVPVEVFEVVAPHQAVALRLDDCKVVARAPLP